MITQYIAYFFVRETIWKCCYFDGLGKKKSLLQTARPKIGKFDKKQAGGKPERQPDGKWKWRSDGKWNGQARGCPPGMRVRPTPLWGIPLMLLHFSEWSQQAGADKSGQHAGKVGNSLIFVNILFFSSWMK